MPAAPLVPSPGDGAADARIVAELERTADDRGFVPFDRFMAIALYGERVGYYRRRASPLGPTGDFYTAAHVHPLFGRTIARRLLAIRRALGVERPFDVVEVGAGDGRLAATILDALVASPDGTAGISYHLLDVSPARTEEARVRAGPAARSGGIRLLPGRGIADRGPFEGVVLANELLDALPARRLRWTGAGWTELGIRLRDGRPEPAESEVAEPVPSTPPPPAIDPGTILEISPAAESWIRSVADHLVRGSAIVLDYGLEEPELLRGHPAGTLASVRHQRSTEDYWSDPGTSDLSMFVNFTRIRSAARAGGLVELAYGSQAEALGAWGFPGLLDRELRSAASPEAEVRTRLAAKNLVFGFERFRALELAAPASAERLAALRWTAA